MSFLFNKLTIMVITIAIFMIIAVTASGMDLGQLGVLFGSMLMAYSVLWLITIPYTALTLITHKKYKPLSRRWITVVWVLLILGYPPATFIIFASYYQGWSWFSNVVIPVFLGPVFVYAALRKTRSY